MTDRASWLRERRRAAEERMDTIWAPIYDDEWGATIDPTHRSFVERVVDRLAVGARILDAACGTGKYWPLLLGDGRAVVGTDQSAAMLRRAATKHPQVETRRIGLQELDYEAAFDAVICIDAMEYLPPEDWPPVLANLRRALRPGGLLYFTVELPDADLVAAAREARAAGAPVVEGEVFRDGGYHYYPHVEQVRAWTETASLALVEESIGDGYHHLLCEAR